MGISCGLMTVSVFSDYCFVSLESSRLAFGDVNKLELKKRNINATGGYCTVELPLNFPKLAS